MNDKKVPHTIIVTFSEVLTNILPTYTLKLPLISDNKKCVVNSPYYRQNVTKLTSSIKLSVYQDAFCSSINCQSQESISCNFLKDLQQLNCKRAPTAYIHHDQQNSGPGPCVLYRETMTEDSI